MASRSSTESIRRKPVGSSAPLPAPLPLDGETKENAGSKALPPLPQSPTIRVPGTPMSPVTLNIQQSDRSPQAIRSVRQVHDGWREKDANMEVSKTSENHNPNVLRTYDLAHRPSYTHQVSEHQQPHMAVISSTEDASSTNPSNGIHEPPSPNSRLARSDSIEEELEPPPVAQFQYHHHKTASESSLGRIREQNSRNELVDAGQSINRHLTPMSQAVRRTPQLRPVSTYSDIGPSRRSPSGHVAQSPSWGGRVSAQSGRSNDRPLSYMDLNNMSYPQMPPAPLSLDNSQLRSVVGSHASLLSHGQTLEMYRQNIKKLNDPETQYAFAVFLVGAAQEAMERDGGSSIGRRKASPGPGQDGVPDKSSAPELLGEAKSLLQKLSDKGYPFAQYYLADGYASGLFSKNGEADYTTAFPLFVSASKHGHAESGYRAALCYEFGWGARKDPAKALQFLRHSASKNHPGAMTRLGRACLSGDLGENKYREGVKWLKRGAESADLQYNAAPYFLGQLYEQGGSDDIFKDEAYAAQLYTQAADLGHPEAAYRMGDAYEHGKLCCPRDPALSVHFYTGAAQRGHPGAMMALCAWYMIGAEPVLEKDENEAYEWARQAAVLGLTKAEYAVGYFTEMGIGCRRDPLEANVWYVKAAAAGDERAKHRIAAINAAASGGTVKASTPTKAFAPSRMKKVGSDNEKTGQSQNEKECVLM